MAKNTNMENLIGTVFSNRTKCRICGMKYSNSLSECKWCQSTKNEVLIRKYRVAFGEKTKRTCRLVLTNVRFILKKENFSLATPLLTMLGNFMAKKPLLNILISDIQVVSITSRQVVSVLGAPIFESKLKQAEIVLKSTEKYTIYDSSYEKSVEDFCKRLDKIISKNGLV